MGKTRGTDCKLYYDATPLAGDPSTGNWTEMDNVRDLNQNLETGEADATTRGNNGWEATAATLKNGEISFQMFWDTADAAFTAIQEAWAQAKEIAIAAMDGAIASSGSQGLAGNFSVTNFSRSEPLRELVTVDVTLKPSSYTTWYKVP